MFSSAPGRRHSGMDFDDTALERYREDAKRFVDEHVTDEVLSRHAESGTAHDWELHRAVAASGVIADGLRTNERAGRDPLEMFVLFDELGLAGAPFYGLANTMIVAGIIEEVGSDFHRCEVLPLLQSGKAIVAFGYSEPDAGSDLASCRTRATLISDGKWRIRGQKMFTSHAEASQFVILLTRTSDARHGGLTVFLVPLDRPGIEIHPMYAMSGERTNILFLSDVEVDDQWRLGETDGGWDVLKIALAYERGVFGNTNQPVRLSQALLDWARHARLANGDRVLDDPAVRVRLARIEIDSEVSALLRLRAAVIATNGGHPTIEGAAAKLFASEAYVRAAQHCQDITGAAGLLDGSTGCAPGDGIIEHAVRDAPATAIYGGTSEVQRNLIAHLHLGLPR
jgi:alkylation response protein AidB-like acyl-CoA dehydrogenase